jgi:hypothetical protein
MSCARSFWSASNRSICDLKLQIADNNEAGSNNNQNDRGNLQTSRCRSQFGGQIDKPLVKFSFLLPFASLLIRFGASIVEWIDIYNNRRLRGPLWIGGGALIGFLGLDLFFLRPRGLL